MAEKTKEKEDESKFLLRINTDVKILAEHEADSQERSLNGYIVNLVKEDLRQKGVM